MPMMKLGDVAEIRTGVAFRKANEPSADGTHYVLQAKDVLEARLDLNDLPLIELGERGDRHELATGDVIMVSRGRTVAAPLGEIDSAVPTVAAGSVYVLRPKNAAVDPMYLAWTINRPGTQAQLQALAQGSHIPFVSKQSLAKLKIPVPPIEVQQTIGHVYGLSLREKDLMSQLSELRERLTHALCSTAAQEVKK